eukprot:74893-Rhodomonas_salina.2
MSVPDRGYGATAICLCPCYDMFGSDIAYGSRLSLSYPADSTAAFGVLRDWVAARKVRSCAIATPCPVLKKRLLLLKQAAQARKEVERPGSKLRYLPMHVVCRARY